MNWSDTTLTTTWGLAKHEKEVNRQAGYKDWFGLYIPDTAVGDLVITIEDSTPALIRLHTSTGIIETAINPYISKDFPAYAGAVINRIETFDDNGNAEAVFDFHEGINRPLVPLSIYDILNPDATIPIRAEIAYTWIATPGSQWVDTEIDATWQDKIDIAKIMLKYAIETTLSERGFVVDEFLSQELINIVANPETFSLCSDYLTLHLIYTDLSNGGFNELFKTKADFYWGKYKTEFAECFKRLNIDASMTGTATVYRYSIKGKLHR